MIPEALAAHPVLGQLNTSIAGAVTAAKDDLGELTLTIDASHIAAACAHLKNEQQFVRLSSITAVDWLPDQPRFEVVYHLQSIERNLRLRLKCRVADEIDSVTPVWRGANWYEREVFDLFGIRFRNHPNLIRILMPDDWQGHPLRKDYRTDGEKYSYQNE